MVELIALIIFILSFGGVLFILASKIPVLVELPQNGASGFGANKIILKTEEKFKIFFTLFRKQIFLHKFLSWVKCLTLKIETRIDSLLHNLRKKAKEQNLNGKK